MNCVRCNHAMEKTELRGVLLDHCRACRGVWLDAGELEDLAVGWGRSSERLVAQRAAEADAEGARRVHTAGLCPRCDAALLATSLAGVEVDRCRRCRGLYFDGGELGIVLAALRPHPLVARWKRLWARRRS